MKKSIFTPGELVTLLALPRIMQQLCGAEKIEISHPRYKVTYLDGSVREAILNKRETDAFAIVSSVEASK